MKPSTKFNSKHIDGSRKNINPVTLKEFSKLQRCSHSKQPYISTRPYPHYKIYHNIILHQTIPAFALETRLKYKQKHIQRYTNIQSPAIRPRSVCNNESHKRLSVLSYFKERYERKCITLNESAETSKRKTQKKLTSTTILIKTSIND